MLQKQLKDLCLDLKNRRVVGDPPPVLFLGAGASVEAGIGAMTDLFEYVGCADFDAFTQYIEPLTPRERYRLLAEFLQTRDPAHVTPGYRSLGALCSEGYLDVIVTTNLDPLLEDALTDARLWRKDHLVLINTIVRADKLQFLAELPQPRVKVIKLHGDVFHRSMAWTMQEMVESVEDIRDTLKDLVRKRDVLVVGLSLRRDRHIRDLVLSTERVIWYTNRSAVPESLAAEPRVRAIIGDEAEFETLFTGLAEALGVGSAKVADLNARIDRIEVPASTATPRVACTMDDFASSLVGVMDNGQLCGTGYVLSQPRVIVVDGFVAQRVSDGAPVELRTPQGKQLTTTVLHRSHGHPFAPLLLRVPEQLKTPGLALNTNPLPPGLAVHIGVAAGTRPGVSSGVIQDPNPQSLSIAPVGNVDGLVRIEAAVAPGSSGAPVTDDSFSNRGFIVAGSDQPPCFMYPASEWVDALAAVPS